MWNDRKLIERRFVEKNVPVSLNWPVNGYVQNCSGNVIESGFALCFLDKRRYLHGFAKMQFCDYAAFSRLFKRFFQDW